VGSFDELSDNERILFRKLLGAAAETWDAHAKAEQIREVVPISQWVDSEYYVGPDVVRIYDYWKQSLATVFEQPNRYNEVIVDGSIGTGKSSFAELCVLRKLYELSCYKNVQALFNLMRKTFITFFYFSLSKYQAELTGFGDIRNFVDSSPYFREKFPRNDRIDSALVWPEQRIILLYGSNPSHQIGMNLISAIMDEANFFQGEAEKVQVRQQEFTKAANLYTAIRQRARSRFLQAGTDHSLSILVSSSTHQTSFTEVRKVKALDDPTVLTITARLWDVKPKGTYSEEVFWVFSGNDLLDPFMVNTLSDLNTFLDLKELPRYQDEEITVEEAIKRLPLEYQCFFSSVPESFRKDFENDLVSSMQNIAGMAVAPIGKLFNSKPTLMKAYQLGEELGYRHPFTKDVITLSTGDSTRLEDFIRPDFFFQDPQKKRYVHIDQSVVSDCTGLGISHIADTREVNGVVYPILGVDLMVRINPPKQPHKIPIARVREFLFWLAETYGIEYGKITYDCYASEESLQAIEALGIPCGHLSVDRNDGAYKSLVNLLFEERCRLYHYLPFEEELMDLVHDRAKGKVDHLPSGSKDVADGVCGSLYNALSEPLVQAAAENDMSVFMSCNKDNDDPSELFSLKQLLM
jgi:hypothetical protein